MASKEPPAPAAAKENARGGRVEIPGLQIASDLHIESRGAKWTAAADRIERVAPYLALLGDVGCLAPGSSGFARYSKFLRDCSERWERVFLVLGEHEFYGMDVLTAKHAAASLAAELGNVTVMDRTRVDLEIPAKAGDCEKKMERVALIGATLWSRIDPSLSGYVASAVDDYSLVRISGWNLRPSDTAMWHADDASWIEGEIDACRWHAGGPVRAIVLTHHAPMVAEDANGGGDDPLLRCARETDLSRLMGPHVEAWFHGHTHRSGRRVVGGTLVASNQRGRGDGSDCGFDRSFVHRL